MILEKVWKDPLFITDDRSFVCVCSSVSYSSLGSETHQIPLVFAPKLERAAEERNPHSAWWGVSAHHRVAEVVIETGDHEGGSVSILWGPLIC